MVLQNYVMLEQDVPARVHFYDHHIESRTITDPQTGGPSVRNVLVFEVDSLNGRPCVARYSTMAEKHALQFKPYLDTKSYRNFDFLITKHGSGYRTDYTLQVIPKT